MTMSFNKDKFLKKLQQSKVKFQDDLSTINTRTSANILNPVKVEAYGDYKPITHVANVSVSGPMLLTVQPWDKGLTQAIVKAIQSSGIGLNPVSDGGVIKINIPPITNERREEYKKLAKVYLENAKIAFRNIRNEERKELKDSTPSEDDLKRAESELQKIFDAQAKEMDEALELKLKEIQG